MTIQHILVPVDGSALSEEAALTARDLATHLAARLTVFYALPSADAYVDATLPAFVDREQIAGQELAQIHALISAAATTYLNALVTRLQQSTKASASSPVGLETAQSDQPHRASSILRPISTVAAPKILSRTRFGNCVASRAPRRLPNRNPRQINEAIRRSTSPCFQ